MAFRETDRPGATKAEPVASAPEPPALQTRTGAILMDMINGFRISQAIFVAASLGLADLLVGGPQQAEELAQLTNTHAPSLYRLLRALASVGIFAENTGGRFELTPLAELLRTDVTGSLRGWALLTGEPSGWPVWADLLYSVRTGEAAFRRLYGTSVWHYREEHPEANKIFNDAMTSLSTQDTDGIVAAYDFSGMHTIVDVAGGHGALLVAILRANPQMRGVLFDRAHVVAGAQAVLHAGGVADRCRTVSGDMFTEVPADADAYILKSIIHDWYDDRAVAILRHCRKAMPSHARLLIAERVIPAGNSPHPGKFMDLHMLVAVEGRERTAAEFDALLAASGFAMTRIIATGGPMNVIEAIGT